MSTPERIAIIVGSILVSLGCIGGSIYLYSNGQVEAGSSLLALAAAGGIASLVARVAGRSQLVTLGLASAIAVLAGACGAVCDVYDATHAASCELCQVSSGEECQGPACAACEITADPCPWREDE